MRFRYWLEANQPPDGVNRLPVFNDDEFMNYGSQPPTPPARVNQLPVFNDDEFMNYGSESPAPAPKVAPPKKFPIVKPPAPKQDEVTPPPPDWDASMASTNWLRAEIERLEKQGPHYPYDTEHLAAAMLDAWRALGSPGEGSDLWAALFNSQIEPGATEEEDQFDPDAQPRYVALSFAIAYQDSPLAVKMKLIPFMIRGGLKQVYKPGQKTYFNGILMDTNDDVLGGDPVEVVYPGWLTQPHGEYDSGLIQKAFVKKLA